MRPLVASRCACSRASASRLPTRAPNASWKLIRAVIVGVGRCAARRDVGLRRPHHLHHQAGVERVAGVDVLGEAVRVDERRVRRDVALHVVGVRDHREQLHVGAQPAAAGVADGDGALHRRLRLRALGRECARATARSIDVAVARRWAAAMNASASCWLSVPSAWRSSAAIRASILSSVMRATRLGLLADKRVERRDHLWRKRSRLGEVGDAVAGSSRSTWLTPFSSTTFSAVCLSASISGCSFHTWPDCRCPNTSTSTGVPAGTLAASATGSILSASATAFTLPGLSDGAEPLRQLVGHGALGPDLVDGRQPGRPVSGGSRRRAPDW